MRKLPLELIGGLVVSLLGLLTFFGVFLYRMQQEYNEYGYPETSDEWAAYVGICLFLLGVLVFVIVAPLRAGTGRLITGPALSFFGLLTFFGALLYALQLVINEHGYPHPAYVGTCLFLLGVLVFVIVAPLRAGTKQLMMGPAVSLLGLLTFFGAFLFELQVSFNSPYYQETGEEWAAYVGTCVFLLGGLILMANVLWQLRRQIRKGEQAASTDPPS